ncbi:Gfo/Idh/MocA family protein [Alteribacillus sp. HJP-4]|uniref:Gfo/Idh/MocA family protein n=1 Tax=Alteribacillus sp. HJP-4 TaxID=2775394 RepID=UPI0035CD1E7D
MIRIGLIGCGYISNKHLDTISTFPELSLQGVSDLQSGRMEDAIQYYKQKTGSNTNIKMFSNYNNLLKQPDIDVVVISVISGLHAIIAKQALTAGKHIILEKPLALSMKDTDEIIKLSDIHDKQVLVCHQLRYHPLMQKIKQLLEDGSLGKPYFGTAAIRINRTPEYYTSAGWRGSWEQDGGMLINQGIHLIDLLIWLMGDIETVYGDVMNTSDVKETEDIAAAMLSFKNKAKGVIEANTITQPKNIGYSMALFCEKGTICLGPGITSVEHCYISGMGETAEELVNGELKGNEHYLMYQNFLAAITKKENLLMNAREGKRALEAIFAIYQSSTSKNVITLPVTNFSTGDMAGKN